jgi:hypothetical protein
VTEPKTVAEQLDAAQTGEEFGAVVMGLFTALEKAMEERVTDLQAMADQILAAARNGALIFPGPSIHRRLVEEMGGTSEWEAMTTALDIAKEEITW